MFSAPLMMQAQVEASIIPHLELHELRPGPSEWKEKLPFSSIKVLDRRFDTSKVGYARRGGKDRKLVLPSGVQAYFNQQFQQSLELYFDSATKEQLVIVIKELWMQDADLSDKGKGRVTKPSEYAPISSECRAVLELYLRKDDLFTPLLRMDSTFDFQNRLSRKASSILWVPFETSMLLTTRLDLDAKRQRGRKLTEVEVERYYANRIQLPIFHANHLQNGIYRTFKDFAQNRIQPCEYTIVKEAGIHHVYIINSGAKELVTDFWGLCDGNKFYIKAGFHIYELVRQGNSFEFFGGLSAFTHRRMVTGPYFNDGSTITTQSPSLDWFALSDKRAHQINMETGNVY
jgi:hypothetical protein